jgi:required for meiotic nuclear division protein 1
MSQESEIAAVYDAPAVASNVHSAPTPVQSVQGTHTFHAVAFVENFSLKELAAIYPEARRTPHELTFQAAAGGSVFMYPSGAVVFYDVGQAGRETELLRLRRAMPTLTSASMLEEFAVREVPGAKPDIQNGCLVLDALTFERASIVALTVGQSAAMEYYERIVDQMFVKTDKIVEKLEKKGTISIFGTRALHRFIGQAVGTRSEVLSVLHLLDKPDAAWDDPGATRIYEELRSEFDLIDRHAALEQKLRSVQEALELVTDVARDRRMAMLETSIVLLIVFEIALSLFDRFK